MLVWNFDQHSTHMCFCSANCFEPKSKCMEPQFWCEANQKWYFQTLVQNQDFGSQIMDLGILVFYEDFGDGSF